MRHKNPFQSLMAHWDEVLPYNAVHVIGVELPLDMEELRSAIQKALARCGFSLDLEAIPLRECRASELEGEGCAEAMRYEINRRFENCEGAVPFRFIYAPTGKGEFAFGVCYHHVIAGGDSICWLLEDILSKYIGEDESRAFPWSGEKAPMYRTMMRRHWRSLWRWAQCFPEDIRRSRGFIRPPKSNQRKASMGVQAIRFSGEQWDWIQRQMANNGANFNDVLITLILLAVAESSSSRSGNDSRRDIAIGSIVNTRDLFGPKHARTFGLFLGFVTVAHSAPEGITFEELLAAVQDQTRRIRMDGFHLWNVLKLKAGLLWLKLLSPEKRLHFFRENFSLSAGVTTFSVERFQDHLLEMPVTDYWRSVSASPATPLALASTYLGGRANITLNYDLSVYSDREVSAFAERFLKQMDAIPSL